MLRQTSRDVAADDESPMLLVCPTQLQWIPFVVLVVLLILGIHLLAVRRIKFDLRFSRRPGRSAAHSDLLDPRRRDRPENSIAYVSEIMRICSMKNTFLSDIKQAYTHHLLS